MRWWQIRKRDSDLERELQSDFELEEEEQRENGLSKEEARHAAQRAFGNTTLIREQTHEAWGWASSERLLQDARYALRQLWRAPGFSIVAMRPLPFAQPDRLVTIEEKVAEWSNLCLTLPVSANHFTFWQQHNTAFDSIAIMQQYSVPLGAGGRPLQVAALSATPGIFSVLQVQPELGRSFAADEAQRGHEHVAILTYAFGKSSSVAIRAF
jgi:hypothetical protein